MVLVVDLAQSCVTCLEALTSWVSWLIVDFIIITLISSSIVVDFIINRHA